MDVAMHPGIEPVAFLLGTWTGRGRGSYPTIGPFSYEEHVTFSHVGKPFLVYEQRTYATDDDRLLHVETGYWRAVRPDWVEIVLAQPTGIVEVDEGPLDTSSLHLRSVAVARTGSAKPVTEIQRDFTFDGPVMRYSMDMAAVGVPLAAHLEAQLTRQT